MDIDDNTPLGQTEQSLYTVPSGKKAYLLNFQAFIESNKEAQVILFFRENADDTVSPFSPRRQVNHWDVVNDDINIDFDFSVVFPEKTDVWVTAIGPATGSNIEVSYRLLLAPNNDIL